MKLMKEHKYQKGFYHLIQLYDGSATPIYLVMYLVEFIVAFSTKQEGIDYINSIN